MSTWQLKDPVKRYLGGKLPVPEVSITIGEDIHRLELVPCNPDKQNTYPDFIGYLKWYVGDVSFQFGVNSKDGNPYLKSAPSPEALDPLLLKQGLETLIKKAEEEGHIFPKV